MNQEIITYVEKYPEEIQNLFQNLRTIILNSTDKAVEEKLWAKLPSYYVEERFIRLIPFKDHINIEAHQISDYADKLAGYKFTATGMVQIGIKQAIPEDILKNIFNETLEKAIQ